MSNYGIDVDGPVPEDDSRLVNVSVTSINVDDVQLANIRSVVKLSLENGDENGFHSFVLALELLSAACNDQSSQYFSILCCLMLDVALRK